MRPLLLLLMFLAPAMSPLFAQKQLPASIQPYAVNWGYSVKSMFQAAGYDVPGPKAAFDLRPTIQTRSEAPRLDSTISYYGYDLNLQDSLPLLRNVHTYPQEDVEVVTEYFFSVDHWVPLSRTTLISDELGRLVDAFSMGYDEATGTYTPDSRIEFFPHGNSLTEADSFFVSGWAPELKDWHRLLAVWNTFDGAGRLKESLSSTELFEFPIVFIDRYYYNNDNEVSGIESFNIDGGEEYPAERQSFWYTDHLLTTSITSAADGSGGFVDESKNEYTYTPFGKEEMVQSYTVDLEKNEWKLWHVDAYAYDDQERVSMKEEVTSSENGGWDRQMTTYDYFMDEFLNTESGFYYDQTADEWVLEEKTYYFYNGLTAYDPVDPDEVGVLEMWPNPSTGIVRLQMAGKASVDVYSLSGQVLGHYQLTQGENTINFTSLPAGIYHVMARRQGDYYAGKLILQHP